MFQGLPHILKKYIQIDDNTGLSSLGYRHSGQQVFSSKNESFLSDLEKTNLLLGTDRNSFKIIHLAGAHPPFRMDRNSNIVNNIKKNTIYEHSQGALNIAYRYIDKLKESGVYDRTVLVVMADHGTVTKFRNPLMLIKPKNSHNTGTLKIDDRAVSYVNLQATLADLMGLPYQAFGTPFRVENQTDKRFFFWYSWDFRWGKMAYLPTMFEYEINGNAADRKSWKLTGERYGEKVDDMYKLASTIIFSKKGNGKNYTLSGFSRNEKWGTWTDGDVAIMNMRVKKGENKDLFLKATLRPYLGKRLKEQVVTVFANNQEIAKWHIAQKDTYQAKIPATVMLTDNIELKFKISNPLSPASEGLSSDRRELGIGLYDMVINDE